MPADSEPRSRPEVLAPAGDDESLRAAVRAGADAVYFGLESFNARARAQNFTANDLAATMMFLHEHGVKGYVALNTLVFDAELPAVEASVRACAAADVDAVIVQDLGVMRLARAIAPGLRIHASTQMTCTDASSVDFAASLGAARVVLARELSVDDIAAIRAKTAVELEVFVHGALCIAYSGQCLTSEAIGGRSANRGACAQACRLPYELVVDGAIRPLDERAFLLSPGDLEASAYVPRLVELGVSSLKIEGRLKGPEYVAATTRLYRQSVDAASGMGPAPGRSLRDTALQTYSRGSSTGFLGGVNHQQFVEGRGCDHRGLHVGTFQSVVRSRGRTLLAIRLDAPLVRGDGLLVEGGFAGEGEVGGRVWTVSRAGKDVDRGEPGDEVHVWLGPEANETKLTAAPSGRRVFKTSDPVSEQLVRTDLERSPHRIRLSIRIEGSIGEPARIEGSTERGTRAIVQTDAPIARAERPGRLRDALNDKLARLGDTAYVLDALEVALPSDAHLPPASLNRARRALVSALAAASHGTAANTDTHVSDLVVAARPPAGLAPPPPGLFVLCRTLAQAEAAMDAGADGVYLDFLELTGTGEAVRSLRARGSLHITLAPPRIRKPGEEKIDHYLASLAPDAILVRSLGALREIREHTPSIPRIGDFSLNVTNRLSAAEVLSHGLSAFTPAFDLDAEQLQTLVRSPFGPHAEVVVHHPMPLFHMEHCVIAALLSDGRTHRDCGRPCERHRVSLRDRAGMEHPVEADVGCRNTVFHAAAQSAASLMPDLRAAGVRRFRIELVRESRDDVHRVIRAYRDLLDGRMSPTEVWRALRTEGGYGVVKGSLRVL